MTNAENIRVIVTMKNHTAEKEKLMSKRKEKPLPHNKRRGSKIIKARYDAKSHFAAFDIRPIRLDGKRARVLRRGTVQGANRKDIEKMLMRVAETFACREIELESVGNPTTVEIIEAKEHHNV
jgi:hypothetical protein